MDIQKKNKSSEEIKIPVKYLGMGLVVVVLIALFFIIKSTGALTGLAVSNNSELSLNEAQAKILNFFETSVPESNITIVSSSEVEGLYLIEVIIDGEEVPIYMTMDGKFIVTDPSMLIPFDQ